MRSTEGTNKVCGAALNIEDATDEEAAEVARAACAVGITLWLPRVAAFSLTCSFVRTLPSPGLGFDKHPDLLAWRGNSESQSNSEHAHHGRWRRPHGTR